MAELIKLCDSNAVTLEKIKLLVENGQNINHIDIWENTPLFWLCDNDSVTLDMIKYIVNDCRADINHQDKNKFTPIIWLCENKLVTLGKKLEIIRYIERNNIIA